MSGRGERGRGDRGGYRRASDRGSSPRRGGFSPGRDRGDSRGRGSSSTLSFSPSRASFRGSPDRGGSPHRGMRGSHHGQVHASPQIFRANNVPESSREVAALEAAYESAKQDPIEALGMDMANLSVLDRAPPRPGYVTLGNPCTVWTNYMEATLQESVTVYKYAITINPEPRVGQYRRIVQLLLDNQLDAHRPRIATDWRSILLLPGKLPEDLLDQELPVQYVDGSQITTQPTPTIYQVTLSFTGQHSYTEILEHVRQLANEEFVVNKENIIQALNIILNHKAKGDPNRLSKNNNANFPLTGLSFPPLPLGGAKQVLKGFLTSFRPVTGRTLINMQVKHATVWAEGPLTAVFDQGSGRLDEVHRAIRGVRVDLTHVMKGDSSGARIPTVRTISGLATQWDGRPSAQDREQKRKFPPRPPKVYKPYGPPNKVQFWLTGSIPVKGLQPSTFVYVDEYFRVLYAKNVRNSSYPVVNVGSRLDPMYVPAELCRIMPGQLVKAALTPAETAAMIRHTLKTPFESASEVVQRGPGAACLDESNETLRTFGVDIDRSLITVTAHKLAYPPVTYQRSGPVEIQTTGSWNLSGVKFVRPAKIFSLATMTFTTDRSPVQSDADAGEVTSQLISHLQELGMTFGSIIEHVTVRKTDDVNATVASAYELLGYKLRVPHIILVILPDQSRDLYNQVKRFFDLSKGILTQCCQAEKVKWYGAKLRQYLANIAMKMNVKCGGLNHTLSKDRLGPVANDDTMLVGMDVTHPSAGSSVNAPSIAAMVSTYNSLLAQWPVIIKVQERRKEMITEVANMFKTRLVIWQKNHNSRLPRNVIIYRDGVSEGQYDQVMSFEFAQMREACKEVYPANDTKNGFPRMSLIVVGKRHHTRFYPTKESDMDKRGNLCSGTLVDRGVTFARTWDFFLQSHEAIQGTARPAHYIVLHDEVFKNFKFTDNERRRNVRTQADLVVDFTYNICHLWCRATKAVSICPPAYYADIACDRARRYLAPEFEPDGASVASGMGGQSGEGSVTSPTTPTSFQLIEIAQQLVDKMFYV